MITINTLLRPYQYKFLPFDLSDSPIIFQQVMNNLVENTDGIETPGWYNVHAPDRITYDAHLLKLFQRIYDKINVALSPKTFPFLSPILDVFAIWSATAV